MNPEHSKDPREQMEVRITALLLGEASAFEEAELLEAIKADPELESYYEEMRRTVKQVEESIQPGGRAASDEPATLSNDRRSRLNELFLQPGGRTIKLESPADRARRISLLQQIGAIAAALIILIAVVGTLIVPRLAGRMAMARFGPANDVIDQLGQAVDTKNFDAPGSKVGKSAQNKDLAPFSPLDQSGDNASDKKESPPQERFLERYSFSPSVSKMSRNAGSGSGSPSSSSAQGDAAIAPGKATIYLPTQIAQADNNVGASYSRDGNREMLARSPQSQVIPRDFFFSADAAPQEPKSAPAKNPGPALALQSADVAPKQIISAGTPIVLSKRASGSDFESARLPEAVNDRVVEAAAKPADLALNYSLEPVARPGQVRRQGETVSEPALVAPTGILGRRAQMAAPAPAPVPNAARASETTGRLASVDGVGNGLGPEQRTDLNGIGTPALSVPARSLSVPFNNVASGTNVSSLGAVAPVASPRPMQMDAGIGSAGVNLSESKPDSPGGQPMKEPIAGNAIPGGGVGGMARGYGGIGGRSDDVRFTTGTPPVGLGIENALVPSERAAAGIGDSSVASASPQVGLESGSPPKAKERVEAEALGKSALLQNAEAVPALGDLPQLGQLVRSSKVQAASGPGSGVEPARSNPHETRNSPDRILANDLDALADGRVTEPKTEFAGEPVQERALSQKIVPLPGVKSASQPVMGDKLVDGSVFETDNNQETEARAFRVNPRLLDNGLGVPSVETKGRGRNGGGAQSGLKDNGSVIARASSSPEGLEFAGGRIGGGAGFGGGGSRFLTATNGLQLKSVAASHQFEFADVNRRDSGTQSRFDALADTMDASSNAPVEEVQLREAPALTEMGSPLEPTQPANESATKLQDAPPQANPAPPILAPLPEVSTKDNPFSTFSLNVSDVSFQLAASSLEHGQLPPSGQIRSEEFVNAFNYHDPSPAPGQRVAFAWDRARNPFAFQRDLLRFSVQTAAAGREPGQPLNLVLLLDNSGSMERSDRVHITEAMLRVLAAELTGYDRVSVIAFARTPRLIVDGMAGGNPEAFLKQVLGLNPDGGTNLEEAMKLAYEIAARHYLVNANNRVILITDGAANLGNVDPEQLRERVIEQRKKGIALDCFGIGWEGYNDTLLEQLSRNGDGRYAFLNDAEQAPAQFASELAGALQVAAADVKAQVEFNPNRVTVYRQIGYQQHQLTKEQFRDNTVDAAEIGAAETGNALYSVEIKANGNGPIGTFRVRYRVPSTGQFEEKEWPLPYEPIDADLQEAPPAMRLAGTAATFAEWLANSPYAQTVTPDALQKLLRGVPEVYAPDPRPAKLQTMIQQARAIGGR